MLAPEAPTELCSCWEPAPGSITGVPPTPDCSQHREPLVTLPALPGAPQPPQHPHLNGSECPCSPQTEPMDRQSPWTSSAFPNTAPALLIDQGCCQWPRAQTQGQAPAQAQGWAPWGGSVPTTDLTSVSEAQRSPRPCSQHPGLVPVPCSAPGPCSAGAALGTSRSRSPSTSVCCGSIPAPRQR